MRLFFALLFEEDVKENIGLLRDVVADRCVKGRFTLTDNFHLTLSFIGEVSGDKAAELEDILDALVQSDDEVPEKLTGSYVGSFPRRERQILWLGVERDKTLKALQKRLLHLLREAGFKPEEKRFHPHITLGRQVLMQEDLSSFIIQPIELKVKSVALMESKQVDGVLRYTPIAIVP